MAASPAVTGRIKPPLAPGLLHVDEEDFCAFEMQTEMDLSPVHLSMLKLKKFKVGEGATL